MFTRAAKEIIVAAKKVGGSEGNPRLEAYPSARAVSMPNDNINRAIKRGTGEIEVQLSKSCSMRYGPEVAIILSIMTDNRNRTASDISIFPSMAGT